MQELFEAWLRNTGINEYEFSTKLNMKGKPAPGLNDIPDGQRLKTARRMLTESLSLLEEEHKWFSVRDFAAFSRTRTPDMIVKSIAEDDALNMNLTYRGIYTGESSDLHDGIPRASNWHVVEGEFVAKALWMLSVLGVVYISEDLKWFSMTPEGRYCLGLTDEPVTESEEQACLVVQPNFEIVVYPRKARPESLHFLGTFCDLESDQESLVYKMSLNSIYRAADAGLDIDAIFAFLKKNSTTSIPDNVEKTLQEWWDRCNMIFFAETADLIELSEAEPYDRLPDSFKKQAIRSGDFLIFPDKFHHSTSGIEVADYQDRAQCCRIDENGTIYLNKKKVDVFLLSYFRKFTEEVKETHKEYVRKLDEKAVGSSDDCTADKILDTLEEVSPEIPASIAIKLRALENKLPPAKTFKIVAICLPETLRDDELDSKLLKKHSLGRIKDYWLLTSTDFDEMKKKLRELGLKVESEKITSKKGMSVEAEAEKVDDEENGEKKLDDEEKLKVIEKAIKNGLQMQIVYKLPDGEQDMLVKPTQVLTSNEEKIVEAVDDTTGMSVMLTAEKITGIKKVSRPSGRY
ncbi:MAG: helicase-associated domain-containing protein [Planctomycetota bacterium]|nr:helicase-associated domain-containing protein [Planctomycetota bacterium]